MERLEEDFAVVGAHLRIEHPLGHINVTRYDGQSSQDIVCDCTPQELQALSEHHQPGQIATHTHGNGYMWNQNSKYFVEFLFQPNSIHLLQLLPIF